MTFDLILNLFLDFMNLFQLEFIEMYYFSIMHIFFTQLANIAFHIA